MNFFSADAILIYLLCARKKEKNYRYCRFSVRWGQGEKNCTCVHAKFVSVSVLVPPRNLAFCSYQAKNIPGKFAPLCKIVQPIKIIRFNVFEFHIYEILMQMSFTQVLKCWCWFLNCGENLLLPSNVCTLRIIRGWCWKNMNNFQTYGSAISVWGRLRGSLWQRQTACYSRPTLCHFLSTEHRPSFEVVFFFVFFSFFSRYIELEELGRRRRRRECELRFIKRYQRRLILPVH